MSSPANISGFFPPIIGAASFEDIELNDRAAAPIAASEAKSQEDDTEWVIIKRHEDEASSAPAAEDEHKGKGKASQRLPPTGAEKKTWLKYLGRAIEKVAEEMVEMIEREKKEGAYEDERELERALEEKEREKEALEWAMEYLADGADE